MFLLQLDSVPTCVLKQILVEGGYCGAAFRNPLHCCKTRNMILTGASMLGLKETTGRKRDILTIWARRNFVNTFSSKYQHTETYQCVDTLVVYKYISSVHNAPIPKNVSGWTMAK